MTLAACSVRRRCWSWASMIACSSCTFGSARSLNDMLSLAPMYLHQRLRVLNMRSMLDGARRWWHRTGLPEVGRFLQPQAQRLELAHARVDVVAQGSHRAAVRRVERQLDGAGHGLVELGVEATQAVERALGHRSEPRGRVELGREGGGRLLQIGSRRLVAQFGVDAVELDLDAGHVELTHRLVEGVAAL